MQTPRSAFALTRVMQTPRSALALTRVMQTPRSVLALTRAMQTLRSALALTQMDVRQGHFAGLGPHHFHRGKVREWMRTLIALWLTDWADVMKTRCHWSTVGWANLVGGAVAQAPHAIIRTEEIRAHRFSANHHAIPST